METTKRFDEAVTKLYNAFNRGTLDAFNCSACAVGNMLDGYKEWVHIQGFYTFNWEKPKKIKNYRGIGYSTLELIEVEKIFMNKCKSQTKKTQFNGLMAVIDYLAELDNIKVPQITVEQFKTVLTEA